MCRMRQFRTGGETEGEINMKKEEFKQQWDKVKTKSKIVRLNNEARFFVDSYSFFELEEGTEKVAFGLDVSGSGYCNLADVVEVF